MGIRRTFITLMSLLALTFTTAANAENVIGVAAKVNGYQIKEEKLQKAVETRLSQQGTNVGAIRDPDKYKQLRHEVLDVLIGQVLLWQSAQKENLVASDEEVETLYKQYVSQYSNENAFKLKMQQEGYNEASYRQELKQRISARKWVEAHVMKDLQISDKEVHEFYTSNKEKFVMPGQVHARHILIKVDSNSSEEDKRKAREQLQDIKKQLDAGADFAEMAKQYSQGPSAPQGGDLGFFPSGKMVKPFEDAAFALQPGEVSDIVETRFGYHLIKVEAKQEGKTIKEEEVDAQIRQYLLKTKSGMALNEAIDELKASARIEKYIF